METPDTGAAGLSLTAATLAERLDAFVGEYLRGKSAETVGTYRRALSEFERWHATQHSTFRFRAEDIDAYKSYLMDERQLSQVSVSTYLTALRRFVQYLVERGDLPENTARTVKGNRRPTEHTRHVLSEAEITRLTDILETATTLGRRDRAIILLMLYAGLSEIEIVRANVEDLEQTLLGWFLRVQGKGHTVKDQQVLIDPPVMDAIRLYLDVRGRIRPEQPLFVSHGHRSEGKRLNTRSVRTRVNHALHQADLKRPGITPHSLTHTAALLWLNDGLTLEEVKQRMRHGTLDTTMIYARKQGLLRRDQA